MMIEGDIGGGPLLSRKYIEARKGQVGVLGSQKTGFSLRGISLSVTNTNISNENRS